ncbi:MAG: VTT domain-containing protein [Opitutaceae bacterium]
MRVVLALSALALFAAVAGYFALRGANLRALFDRAMDLVRAAGPLAFFAAMAVLPAVGAPIMAFILMAGPAFEPQLGRGGVLAACAASNLLSMSIGYWLARRWLRPWLEGFVARSGHPVPQVMPADQFEVTLILRITPGPPFFLQNFLLGLAKIPFPRYLAVSWTVVMMHTTGLVIFGGALINGKGKEAVLGISLFVAALLAIHILRRHYAKRSRAN